MNQNGAVHLQRTAAFLLTVLMLVTTCFTSAMAMDLRSEIILNLLWEDEEGMTQTVTAVPVPDSDVTAYFAKVDASALGKTIRTEVICPDLSCDFFLLDEAGNPSQSFVWTLDAQELTDEYAYLLKYSVMGVTQEEELRLYVSSGSMPEISGAEIQLFPAQVKVLYVTAEGEMLDSQIVECMPGTSATIVPQSAYTAGYELTGEESVEVLVNDAGLAFPAEVVFVYTAAAAPEQKPAKLPVYYYHNTSGELLDMQEVVLEAGHHTISADSDRVAGMQLVSDASVAVTVYPDGTSDLESIVFRYDEAAPTLGVLPVYYYHTSGELLDMQEVVLEAGQHIVKPESSKVTGLILESDAEVAVTVNPDGTTSVESVVFLYMSPEQKPAEAVVTVQYIHVDYGVIDTQTFYLGEGAHTVKADSDTANAYLPLGNTEAKVVVDKHGNAEPGMVEFYYEDAYVAPVKADLVILYKSPNGMLLGQDTVSLTPGDHTITPDADKFNQEGYTPSGEQSWTVYVDENGMIEPASVEFVYQQSAAKVIVRYQDDRGRPVVPEQEILLTQDGTHIIKANLPDELLDQYELAPGQSGVESVAVIGGVPNKPEIYFYYQQKQTGPVSATVTVCYYDPDGNEIAPAQTITLMPGIHQVQADSAETFRGYELVSDASITVEVFENGTFSPQEVAFYYRFAEEKKPAAVTIYFRDDRGNDVAEAQTHMLPDGEHVIEAPAVNGYTVFAGTDSRVTVTVQDGVATNKEIVFYYQKVQTTPSVFTIPVSYYDTMGTPVATTQYVQVGPGTYALQANPDDLPEGYELMMNPVMTVKVNRDGTTDPEEIAFYYRAPVKKATVSVFYFSEDGIQLASPYSLELGSGYHTITPDAARVPAGYDPESAQPVKVYVSKEGEAEPASVILTFEQLVIETPIPVGEMVYRYANVNSSSVAFRSEPSTSGKNNTVINRLGRNDKVYVLQEMYNEKNELWAMINVGGKTGYMMSEFITIMSREESDDYAGSNTPVPTFTPAITLPPVVTAPPTLEPLPTATITPPLAEVVTRAPVAPPTFTPVPTATITPTASPTTAPTATPAPYQGYALTTRATALRTGISASDMTIMHAMEANTLVRVVNQIPDPATGEMWSIISTLGKQAGFVQDAALRYISDREAQPYLELWEELNREPAPTKLVTPTPEPMQLEGHGIVLGDGVPFRQMQSEFSRIIDHLEAGTMVYISGQTAGEGQYWHSVYYEGRWGYIRADLVRMLTIAEEEQYLESLMASPTPATTNIPFDEEGLSSYGYVDGSAVNWRKGPSTGADKVGELRRYAFCLVLGIEYVGGVDWYHVRYGEETGYIHGDFFRQMTISELEDFLGSDEYLQGVVNNSPNGSDALDDVGFTGTGGLISAEDQWVHDNNALIQNTVNPWKPIPTVQPILNTPTLEPLPGVTPTPHVTPSPTPTFNPLPDVTYPTADQGDGGTALIWVFVLGLLLLAGGGVFALVRHQQNKRRIAMRAAQRRAQAARAQQQQRPYARTAAPGQARMGSYPNQQNQMHQPVGNGSVNQVTNTYAPYSRPVHQDAEQRPAMVRPQTESYPDAGDKQTVPRVGRRTAYRQAQEKAQDQGNEFDV